MGPIRTIMGECILLNMEWSLLFGAGPMKNVEQAVTSKWSSCGSCGKLQKCRCRMAINPLSRFCVNNLEHIWLMLGAP